MIKLNLALRYGAAVVAVAAVVFLVYFYLPQRSAAGKMEAAARAAGGLDSHLSSAHASITQLPGPAVITPGSAGATASYLQALATAGSVSAGEPTVLPKPTANRLRNETVRRYNEAAGRPGSSFHLAGRGTLGQVEVNQEHYRRNRNNSGSVPECQI